MPYRKKVAACAKHYVGDGGTHMGINENNTIINFHGLLSIHMPPYYDAIIKGVSTVMVSYSSWNGVKMHANHYLVTDFLKNKLRFRVSRSYQEVCATCSSAVCPVLSCGFIKYSHSKHFWNFLLFDRAL